MTKDTEQSEDPSTSGMRHIRSTDETAMKLWAVKGPKGSNSTISAVLLDGPKIVILHQFAGGRFKLFEPADV